MDNIKMPAMPAMPALPAQEGNGLILALMAIVNDMDVQSSAITGGVMKEKTAEALYETQKDVVEETQKKLLPGIPSDQLQQTLLIEQSKLSSIQNGMSQILNTSINPFEEMIGQDSQMGGSIISALTVRG